jgi:hypothetical protein
MTKRTTKSYDDTSASAREIIAAEKNRHEAKPARLKGARLAKEAADLLAHVPGEPRARAKAKKGKR